MNRNLEELEKLDELLKKGIISQEEFQKEKDKILNGSGNTVTGNLLELNENTYGFLIHFSVFFGFFHFALGLIVPIILWAINRENSRLVDQHGKNIMNWLFSLTLYLFIFMVVLFPLSRLLHLPFPFSYDIFSLRSVYTSISPFAILMVLNLIFVIIGGLKALSGKLWRYPLSIRFLKS